MIVQEVMHSMRRRRVGKGMMILTLHLEKAYDRLSWDFIIDTLKALRLLDHMVSLIMRCITTCSMRVSWNGKAID